MLTAERVREALNYQPETGALTWRVKPAQRVNIGDAAGSVEANGYIRVCVDGHFSRLHRLAWLWMTGEWPKADVDHIDGNRANNRWVNLRSVSRKLNLQNRRSPQPTNTSGVLGVSRHRKRFAARITVNGANAYLGTFDTVGQAHDAYVSAKRKFHPGNTL